MDDQFRAGMLKAADMCRKRSDALVVERRLLAMSSMEIAVKKIELSSKAVALQEMAIAILTAIENEQEAA